MGVSSVLKEDKIIPCRQSMAISTQPDRLLSINDHYRIRVRFIGVGPDQFLSTWQNQSTATMVHRYVRICCLLPRSASHTRMLFPALLLACCRRSLPPPCSLPLLLRLLQRTKGHLSPRLGLLDWLSRNFSSPTIRIQNQARGTLFNTIP